MKSPCVYQKLQFFTAFGLVLTLLGNSTTRAFAQVAYGGEGSASIQTPADVGRFPSGTIAYVSPDGVEGDEIRLIEPDGSGDRLLWNTGVPGAAGIEDIPALAWNPAATELAFTSRHEEGCSFYGSDIYAIRADGSDYRRVTAPPACGQTAGMPTGSVVLTIQNMTAVDGPFSVYFEGAPGPALVTLPPYDSAEVTFKNVADFGSRDQWGMVAFGEDRFTSISANTDVLPGQKVDGGSIYMYGPTANWSWSSPSWKADGSRIGYLLDVGTPYSIPAGNTTPGEIGSKLFNVPSGGFPADPDFLTWAPPGTRQSQLLYTGWDSVLSGETIYLATAGSSSHGEALVYVDQGVGRVVLGLAWLPDSSGFLYSKTEGYGQYGNIYEYNFATKASTRLTDFTSGYPRRLTVSPDGKWIVFEFQGVGEWTEIYAEYDLWMMDRTGNEYIPFVANGRAPAWSPAALPQPVVLDQKVFLPIVIQ